MPEIDLGIDYNGAVEEAKFKPAPAGVYRMKVDSIKTDSTKAGKPCLRWRLSVIDSGNPDADGKGMNYTTLIPVNGEVTGIGFLVQITTALGKPWAGKKLITESYIGETLMANVTVSDDGNWNNIKDFITEG